MGKSKSEIRMSISTILTCLLLSISLTTASYVKVTWPDYNGPALDSYSGFVTVDTDHGRALHYVLIKAETNPNTAPLIIWFQGGPGCSGLIGLFSENGPLVPSYDSTTGSKLTYSDLSWTKFANVVWLEQPAFVGFSYSNTSSDINTGDTQAAADNYKFVQLFVSTEWPEFAGRDLYFTGESYGGVYVPTLTNLVLSNPGPVYNQFKGFMIGNPVFSCQGGFIGNGAPYDVETFNLLYWHGFVSYSNYANWTSLDCNNPKNTEGTACQNILNTAVNQVGSIVQPTKRDISQSQNWPSLDPDDIYQNFCLGNGSLEFTNYPQTSNCHAVMDVGTSYLNRADVQQILNVPATTWTECSSNLNYDILGNNMVPLYQKFFSLKPGVKILVYSGDVDILTVPFAYTQPCISQIGGSITSAWQPWFVNGATAGYVEVYDKYTYATIKGAGHEAPEYQPLSSFNLIKRFINSGSLRDPEYRPAQVYRRRSMKQGDMLRKYGLSPMF